MTDWKRFNTASELKEWLEEQENVDDLVDEIREQPEGLKKWIVLAVLEDEPAFPLPDELIGRQWDLEDDSAESPYDAFYAAVEEIFKDFTGLEISSSNDTYLDFDDDSKIISAEATSFVASNCTNWSWELEEDGDELCLLFTLDDDDEADDSSGSDDTDQSREILECLASPLSFNPGLYAFFYKMQEVMDTSDSSFFEAWNSAIEIEALGEAIADWRENELTRRLGYEPDSDVLDEVLEEWIRNTDWSEGAEYLNHREIHGVWPNSAS